MQKPNVKIELSNSIWDCEDCGFIEDHMVRVNLPNKEPIGGFDDGHFGGGNWDGGLPTVYGWILESLGYFMVVNDKSIYQPHRIKNHETSFYDISELFMGPLQPIYLTITYETIKTTENGEDYEWSEPDFFTIKFPRETTIYGSKEGMIPFDKNKEDIYEKIVKYFVDIVLTEETIDDTCYIDDDQKYAEQENNDDEED